MGDRQTFGPELHAAFDSAYDLQRELAGGGMSRVFLATERSLNRQVVIKVLPPELAAGVNRERFRREIQMAAQLQHPHIVPLYAAGEHGDLLFYTMPYIEGESLRFALQGSSPTQFSFREVARILHDVVDALAYAHARGVIHRDIKPGNVLRSGSHAVVTDFGVAKAISASLPEVGMTTGGMAIGTPAYMAPEQLAGDPAADHRVDIYAVGLLAYELLTGVVPFSAKSPRETLVAQLTRDPEPIDKTRQDVPPAFASLVMRCLAKMPENRPQSAAELLADMDAMQLVSGHYLSLPRPRSRRYLKYLVAGAAIVVLIVSRWHLSNGMPSQLIADTSAKIADAPAALLLTRAESLSIATAVEKKLAEQRLAKRAADSAAPRGMPARTAAQDYVTPEQVARMVDSMRNEVERAVIDSFVRIQSDGLGSRTGRGDTRFGDPRLAGANARVATADATRGTPPATPANTAQLSREAFNDRAASMGPPRRIFISIPPTFRRYPELATAANVVLDSLRRRLGTKKRYVIIDHDSVRALLAKTRTADSLSKLLKVDLFASLYPAINRDSSVVWMLTVRDLSANTTYGSRSVHVATPHDSLLAPLDSLVRGAIRLLGEMDRAPRRKDTDWRTAPASPTAPAAPPPSAIAPVKKP